MTTPAPDQMVAVGSVRPGSTRHSTALSASSFSVLMTAARGVSGIAPPVYPVPPPRGMIVRSSSMQVATSAAISSSVSGVSTTNGYSTRQSVASVTCETRDRPSKRMLSFAVTRPSLRAASLRRSQVARKSSSNARTAMRARASSCATFASRSASTAVACGSPSTRRRLSTSFSRWWSASISAARRFGFSSRSSCR